MTLAAPPRLLTRPLILLCLSNFGALASFYLLLTVVPMYVTATGGGGIGAGMTTGALMLTTVAAELFTPGLVARYGYRRVLAVGMVLLGAPALLFPMSSGMTVILAICMLRGVGFAIAMVAGGALSAAHLPAERRGEGLGLLGIVAGLPAILALPLGPWLAKTYGFTPAFVLGTLAGLIAALFVLALPRYEPVAEKPLPITDGLRQPSLVAPALIFCTTAIVAGIIVTFLPEVVGGTYLALGLLVHSVSATFARWVGGRLADRHGASRLLAPSVLVTALGMLLLFSSHPVSVIAGMLLAGAGFGVAQSVSLLLMYERVSASGYGTVSAIWNIAYDAGYGIGGAAFGVMAAQTGYPGGFVIVALLVAFTARAARRLEPQELLLVGDGAAGVLRAVPQTALAEAEGQLDLVALLAARSRQDDLRRGRLAQIQPLDAPRGAERAMGRHQVEIDHEQFLGLLLGDRPRPAPGELRGDRGRGRRFRRTGGLLPVRPRGDGRRRHQRDRDGRRCRKKPAAFSRLRRRSGIVRVDQGDQDFLSRRPRRRIVGQAALEDGPQRVGKRHPRRGPGSGRGEDHRGRPGPDVRCGRSGRAVQLFRRHVAGSADHPGHRDAARLRQPGDAEIDHTRAVGAEQDVRRFEIAVHDTGAVDRGQRRGRADREPFQLATGQRSG